jgi:hypothetical protein
MNFLCSFAISVALPGKQRTCQLRKTDLLAGMISKTQEGQSLTQNELEYLHEIVRIALYNHHHVSIVRFFLTQE